MAEFKLSAALEQEAMRSGVYGWRVLRQAVSRRNNAQASRLALLCDQSLLASVLHDASIFGQPRRQNAAPKPWRAPSNSR